MRHVTGGRLPAVPLSTFAEHTDCYDVRDHNDPETRTLIKELELGLLINAESPRILKEPLLRISLKEDPQAPRKKPFHFAKWQHIAQEDTLEFCYQKPGNAI